jgi:hypothetical protein
MEKDDYISGVFREIDDELQTEKLMDFWNKYKTAIISVVAVILMTTAGWAYYGYATKKSNETYTESYYEFIRKSEIDPLKALEDASNDDVLAKDRAFLAQFYQASLHTDHKDFDKATALYEKIIKDSAAPKLYQSLAAYYLLLNKSQYMDAKTLLAEMKNIDMQDSPFAPLILELKASLHYENGQNDEALQIINTILEDKKLPSGLRHRAEIMKFRF